MPLRTREFGVLPAQESAQEDENGADEEFS
jgi:hypothetical protein